MERYREYNIIHIEENLRAIFNKKIKFNENNLVKIYNEIIKSDFNEYDEIEFDQLFTDHIINGESVVSKEGNRITMTNQWYKFILPRMYELYSKIETKLTVKYNLNNLEYHRKCCINTLFDESLFITCKTFNVYKNKIILENGDYISVYRSKS